MKPTRLSVLLLTLTGLSLPTEAETIYQTGFEQPPFISGSLSGQAGWSTLGSGSTAVQTSSVRSGTQAIGISPLASLAFVGAARLSGVDLTGRVVTFSIDANLGSAGNDSFWTVLGTQYAGGASVADFNISQSGELVISVNSGGGSTLTGVFVTRDVWNHYELVQDLANHTISAFYNGTPVVTNAPFTPANNTLFRHGFYAQGAGTDSAAFDNHSIIAVPEPGTMAFLGLGLLGATLVRRRR